MDLSTRTRILPMMISLLVVWVLLSHNAVCGDASMQHQQQQQEAIIDASGHVEFSSQVNA